MKTHAIRIHATGDPSVLNWEEVSLPDPGPGEVLIRHTAIGFNYIDTYFRSGLYPLRADTFPCGLGLEAAGVVEAVGPQVKNFKIGQRVGYAGGARMGAYAEARIANADDLIKLPSWLDDRTAAAVLVKGMTVQYLFNRTHKLKKGETILFHAAAGGLGLVACQWARALGATVIGTVSTDAKAKLAKRYGCRHPIVTSRQDLVSEVMRLTKGKGVDVVYDSVGKDTWDASMECVRRLGLMVSCGSTSGKPPPYDIGTDGMKKSAFITRATTANYMTSGEIRRASARVLFRMMRAAPIKVLIGQTYALKDAARAHIDAEARRTTGSTVLLP
ncbi:MAG: quinone oxidoreductase [Betaproteobacteria bacterium]|nr:quinone oxidoreductase [Betaproteobacteria bacterium]